MQLLADDSAGTCRAQWCVGILLQMLGALVALQFVHGLAGDELHLGVVREKFRNLQPYMMGGQAERMCTSEAPLL